MTIQAVGWALSQEMPARVKLVLVSLANHADWKTGYCWPCFETIAEEASCHVRGVPRFIESLIKHGYLKKEPKRADDGKQRSNSYWVLFNGEKIPWPIKYRSDKGRKRKNQDDQSDDDEEYDGDTTSSGTDDSQSSVDNVDELSDSNDSGNSESCGPDDSRVSHNNIEEPTESNLKRADQTNKKDSALRSYAPKAPPLAAGWYDRQSLEAKALRVLCEITGRESYFWNTMGGATSVCYPGEITDQLLALADAPRKSEWLTLTAQQAASWFQFATRVFPNARINLRAGSKAPWPWPPRKNGLISNSQAPPLEDPLSDEDAAQIRKAG